MTTWLTEQVGPANRHLERLTEALLERYRAHKIEPLSPDSMVERQLQQQERIEQLLTKFEGVLGVPTSG